MTHVIWESMHTKARLGFVIEHGFETIEFLEYIYKSLCYHMAVEHVVVVRILAVV